MIKRSNLIFSLTILVGIVFTFSFFNLVSGQGVIENGVPKCKGPYAESCGNNCSRNITCGPNGEFRPGECKCTNPTEPTCPVATKWNGSVCEGTAKGTNDETNDQAPSVDGAKKVANKPKKPADPKTIEEANNAKAGGGTGGGGTGGTGGAGTVETGGKCVQGGPIECKSGFCCGTGLCSGNASGSDCGTLTSAAPSTCTAAEANTKRCFGTVAKVCQSAGSGAGASGVYVWANTTGIVCEAAVSTVPTTATCVAGSIPIADQPGKCLCSGEGNGYSVNVGEQCVVITETIQTQAQATDAFCAAGDSTTTYQNPLPIINSMLCNKCGDRTKRTQNAAGVAYICNSPIVGWEIEAPTPACNQASEAARNTCYNQAQGNIEVGVSPENLDVATFCLNKNPDEIVQNDRQAITINLSTTGPQEPSYCYSCGGVNRTEISSSGVSFACNDPRIGWEEVEPESNTIKNNSEFDIFNLINKVHAQETPDVVNPSDLKKGKYKFKFKGYKESTVKISQKSAKITYFEDSNGDGKKQDGEPVIDPKTYEVSISKVSDVSVYEIETGWNLIALDFVSAEVQTAHKLAEFMNFQGLSVVQISKYDSGSWIHAVFRINEQGGFEKYGVDFNLTPGEGYFVRSLNDGFAELEGNHFTSSVPINITRGWNLVSVQTTKNYTATTFINKCKAEDALCTTVSNFVDGGYESVIENNGRFFGNDFDLVNTKGYFVLNNSDRKTISP